MVDRFPIIDGTVKQNKSDGIWVGKNETSAPDGSKKVSDSGLNIEFMDVVAFSLSYTTRESDLVWGVLVIVISLVLIAISLFLNWFVFTFYMKKVSRDIVSMIYTLLSGFDIIVSLGGLLSVVSLILYLALDMENQPREMVYPSVIFFCMSSFFISSVATRMSIVINALLSMVRTRMIMNPFATIRKRFIIITLVVVFVFWTMLTSGDLYVLQAINVENHWEHAYEERRVDAAVLATPKQNLYLWYYVFNSLAGYYHVVEFFSNRLPWGIALWTPGSDQLQKMEYILPYILFVLAYLIATIVSVVCLVIQAFHLKNTGFSNNNNKQVTVTIVILTIVFVICNVASIIYIGLAVDNFEHEYDDDGEPTATKDEWKIQNFYRGMFVFQQMVPLLNSALNPVILIWRGSKLKEYLKEKAGIGLLPTPKPSSIALKKLCTVKEETTTADSICSS